MAEEQHGDFTQLLMLLLERTSTFSVRCEAMRVLLEERGILSALEFEQKNAELRRHWDLQNHPYTSLSGIGEDEYFAQVRRILEDDEEKQ
jgi:hypothetical protein